MKPMPQKDVFNNQSFFLNEIGILMFLQIQNFLSFQILKTFFTYFINVLFLFIVLGTCDCNIDCPCSFVNCTAGQYWNETVGCIECPAGH